MIDVYCFHCHLEYRIESNEATACPVCFEESPVDGPDVEEPQQRAFRGIGNDDLKERLVRRVEEAYEQERRENEKIFEFMLKVAHGSISNS